MSPNMLYRISFANIVGDGPRNDAWRNYDSCQVGMKGMRRTIQEGGHHLCFALSHPSVDELLNLLQCWGSGSTPGVEYRLGMGLDVWRGGCLYGWRALVSSSDADARRLIETEVLLLCEEIFKGIEQGWFHRVVPPNRGTLRVG